MMLERITKLFVVAGVAAIVSGGMLLVDRASRKSQTIYAVDAALVVKAFVDQRGDEMEDDELREAVKRIDELANDEARKIYARTGIPILNSRSILVGAVDISDQFAETIIARWSQEYER